MEREDRREIICERVDRKVGFGKIETKEIWKM